MDIRKKKCARRNWNDGGEGRKREINSGSVNPKTQRVLVDRNDLEKLIFTSIGRKKRRRYFFYLASRTKQMKRIIREEKVKKRQNSLR